MAKTSSAAFTVQVVAPPPPLTASFQLTSTVGGTDLPFSMGYAFRKGDIADGTTLTLDSGTSQVVVKRRWNDNSYKHVVISGHATLSAGVAKAIQVVPGTPSGGTPLTSANIQSAAPAASVQCGSIGTVSLASLLGTPVRTWISGPEMVECHYFSKVGSDANLRVWFHVRLYRTGKIWVRAICENGYLDVAHAIKTYVPTVTIGSTVAYNNGGANLTHYSNTRWDVEGWVGAGTDPLITPKHNVAQLIATRLVPNYWKRNPSAAVLNGLVQVYAPMIKGSWTPDMGDSGYQEQIGILPLWDALYCASGDPRAYRSTITNARSLNSYAIVWADSADNNLPTRPSQRPDWAVDGKGSGGSNGTGAGTLVWEMAHHPSGGYLAYLITGDYYFLETMQYQSATCFLCNDINGGLGTSRVLTGQSRAMAWSLRTIGQLAGIGPNDIVTNDYIALLAGNMAHWNTLRQLPGQNPLGILYSNELASGGYGVGVASPWQQNFATQSVGFLSDVEPLTDMSALNAVRDYYYQWPVGLLGGSGATNYCYTQAANYTVTIANVTTIDATQYFKDWGTVWVNTIGPIGACSGPLLGGSGSDPLAAATGYWGNLMPAIAYAVDHGGGLGSGSPAALAWARMTGAPNWSSVEFSNTAPVSPFSDIPIWGIVPRGFGGT